MFLLDDLIPDGVSRSRAALIPSTRSTDDTGVSGVTSRDVTPEPPPSSYTQTGDYDGRKACERNGHDGTGGAGTRTSLWPRVSSAGDGLGRGGRGPGDVAALGAGGSRDYRESQRL